MRAEKDVCRVAMQTLRPINIRIGNLRQHVASRVEVSDNRLVIQFDHVCDGNKGFCVMLEGVLGLSDHGLISEPLTAGILWKPVGPFGREAAERAGLENTDELIELSLDFEDSLRLRCRFQAVARKAALWEGCFEDRPDPPS